MIPKVWFQSVERIGRSGDLIEGVDPLFLFISRFSGGGGLTAPRVFGESFDFQVDSL